MKPRSQSAPNAMPSTWRSQRKLWGFTLIEIMIALGILSGVMVAIYASWSAILKGSKLGMDAAANAQRLRISVHAIEDALISVQMYQENLALYSFYADSTTEFGTLSLVSRLPSSFPGSGSFDDQPVRRVTFSVEPGPGTSAQLVLRQVPLLAPPNEGETSYTVVLAKDISLFAMEFWGQNSKEWEPEWLLTNQLPKLVRVTLGFGDTGRYSSRPREIVSRTIAIPGQIVPRGYQIANAAGGQPVPVPPIQPNRPR